MSRTCEACAGQKSTQTGKSAQAGKSRIRRVLIGERIVALCAEHAAELQLSGARDVEELRALFPEQESRRSLISRRAPLDRRVFPPRPEGRRRSDGRRADDALD